MKINRTLGVGVITPNIYPGRYVSFGQSDTVEISSINRYTTEKKKKKMVENNPKVKNIVKNFNPQLKLNMKELNELLEHHASDTREISKGIINNLPFSLKNKVDKKALEDAAYLHDIGKVLIPPKILNKPGKLDEKETKIMHTHSELSYEILKNSGINEKTLKLIRNHHQNTKRTGYPWVGNDFNADLNLQILSVADKFSALTEKRPYKNPLTTQQAMTIIYSDVKEGKLHPIVFKALVNYVNNLAISKSQPLASFQLKIE